MGFGRPQSRGSTSTSSGIPPQLGLRELGEEGTNSKADNPAKISSFQRDRHKEDAQQGWMEV